MHFLLEYYNYIIVIILMMCGLYVVFASSHMIKKLVGLSLFQTSIFLLYISIAKVKNAIPPILVDAHANTHTQTPNHGAPTEAHTPDIAKALSPTQIEIPHTQTTEIIYSNPLPHVLILTAIVVGVATLAIGLALVVRLYQSYGSLDIEYIDEVNRQEDQEKNTRIQQNTVAQ